MLSVATIEEGSWSHVLGVGSKQTLVKVNDVKFQRV